jgi:vancomycin resistance protein YoaR
MSGEEIDLVDEILGATGLAGQTTPKDEAAPVGLEFNQGSDKHESSKAEFVQTAAAKMAPSGKEVASPDDAAIVAAAIAAASVTTAAQTAIAPPADNPAQPKSGRRRWRNSRLSEDASPARRTRRTWAIGLSVAFAIGAVISLTTLTAAGVVASSAYSSKIVPGVHVGAVDLSGLTRDEAIARLQSSYGYLSQGNVTILTAQGEATIAYEQLGRGPDAGAMADMALGVGHTGNPLDQALETLHTAIAGQAVPLQVAVDPNAVAQEVRSLVSTNQLPVNAGVATLPDDAYAVKPSRPGQGIDEIALCNAIVDGLVQTDAPATFGAGGTLVELKPTVSNDDAIKAILAARKMTIDVEVTFGIAFGSPAASQTPNPTASAAQTSAPAPQVVDWRTVQSWIVFRTDSEGRYWPAADPSLMRSYLQILSQRVQVAPVEPMITVKSDGTASVAGGEDGIQIDVDATARALAAYLDGLASGGSESSVGVVAAPLAPSLSLHSLDGKVNIGSWTTEYYPGPSNGEGLNISTPARILNGKIVAPGEQFDFLAAVSPVDEEHGFAMGGVISGGVSNHTGAMGGGICSASTTVFNAAAQAGLQIDERHPHYYYIDRYPVGLDATVFSSAAETLNLKWTNDTSNPILILGSIVNERYSSTITIQLWSAPLDRNVVFNVPQKSNVNPATESIKYSTKLPVGKKAWEEFASDGYNTTRTRVVTDSTGKIIHSDVWKSKYHRVDGILWIGVSSVPTPTPTAVLPIGFGFAALLRRLRRTS